MSHVTVTVTLREVYVISAEMTSAVSTASPLEVSADALLDIERALATPLFEGVPIGSTLSDVYTVELWEGKGVWSAKAVLSDRVRARYHYWRGLRLGATPPTAIIPPTTTGRIMVTWLHQRPHFDKLVLPLLGALDTSRCVVAGREPSMLEKLPDHTAFVSMSALPPVDLAAWRKAYRRCAPRWREGLGEVLEQHNLPRFIAPRLEDTMIVNSQLVTAYHRLLEMTRPLAVVTEYDREQHASCLVLAAKARGVPTATMMHGVVNLPYGGFVPLLADRAFCWGEEQREQMTALGTPADRLTVTGCHRLTRRLPLDQRGAKEKLGVAASQPFILFGSTSVHLTYRRELARAFCEGVSHLGVDYAGVSRSGVSAAVRLHPSEALEDYAAAARAFPAVRFMRASDCALEEALAAADVVVCHNSGLANDALVAAKPVVILDASSLPLRNGQTLIDKAGCPRAENAQELAALITRILEDEGFRDMLLARAERYVRYFCAAFDEAALKNVASEIEKMMARPVDTPSLPA